jgi:predicted ArsR family transcriptional regulator
MAVVENTRTKILEILRRRREATVEDLTRALELAPATVRRHLDILQRDGFVKVRPVRRDTGRPHFAFSITQAGEEVFPQHYVRITNRLIDEILTLAPEDTAGRSGRELAGVIFERMADRLAASYEGRVTGATLAARLEQVRDLLNAEGIVVEVRQDGAELVLAGRGCPCRRFGEQSEPCEHDKKLLERLLHAHVEPLPAASSDDARAYRVREDTGLRL